MEISAIPDFWKIQVSMFVHGRFTNWGDWSMANSFRTAVKMYVGGETWVNGVPASYENFYGNFRTLKIKAG